MVAATADGTASGLDPLVMVEGAVASAEEKEGIGGLELDRTRERTRARTKTNSLMNSAPQISVTNSVTEETMEVLVAVMKEVEFPRAMREV